MDPITVGLIAGGVSSLAGLGGSFLGNYFNRKNSKDQAALNYYYALRMAEAGPSATVKGLRLANLNPILAATDGAFSTPSMPSIDIKSSDFSQIGKGVSDGIAAFQMANEAKALQSTVETNKSQAFKNFAEGLTKLKNGGLSGGYGAIKTLASSLGINDSDAAKVLKDFGFTPPNPLGFSAPDGSLSSPHAAKSRNAPDDGKSSVEIPPHGPYDSKPYTGSRTGSWRADMNRIRNENLKYNKYYKERRYERWIDYDKSFERMPNVRRSIYR